MEIKSLIETNDDTARGCSTVVPEKVSLLLVGINVINDASVIITTLGVAFRCKCVRHG